MKRFNISYALLLSLPIIFACQAKTKNQDKKSIDTTLEGVSTITEKLMGGNYVSAGYQQRNKGYDWVAVIVEDLGNGRLHIKVRSRADKKKATCTMDAIVDKVDGLVYRASLPQGKVLFEFADDRLTIKGEDDKDMPALYYYCSGGASLAGNYSRITEKIDTASAMSTEVR